ncbi:pantoate--beta-alanine ligase [Flavobacterium sp.]|uniref:pantoate--beta-alanine ligase n=1 Tax=Flavobacterium sp. TaxID=239 RepID=UPI0025C2AF84|nr:pantoate--beta-alanine ligase [Flavobacterium sp.]MBA4153145.1 pantoate--beta-alanine ligase [Flavobacterium sp.]
MLIFNKQSLLIEHLTPFWATKTTIGFVPTMGALHEGHLSLLSQSLKENEISVVSIFVNPTQFNNPEDLAKYPRTLERDVEKIASLNTKVLIYAPTVEDIYHGNTVSQSFQYDGLENQMEGKHRPGHFDGVGTIVKRLFEIIKPTHAYFGEKDFQQLQIVKKLVHKNNIPVKVIGCPIHREANGLAMSSRNERLSPIERKESALIFKTLSKAKKLFGMKSAKEISKFVTKTFENHPIIKLEYFEIADEITLRSCLRKSKNKKYRAFIAVFVNNIRLIDTISLN